MKHYDYTHNEMGINKMDTKIIEALAKTGIIITPITNLQAKINIAKEYIALHKEFYIPLGGGDDGLADIFNGIFLCHFGEARLIDSDLGEYEIEVGSNETKSGNSVLFTFVDPDHTAPYPFIADMKDEGFTNLQILAALEDGAVLSSHDISQEEAEDMHSHLLASS